MTHKPRGDETSAIEANYINHRAEAAAEPDCCWGKTPYVGIIENVIVHRGIFLAILQIINGSIDLTGNDVHGFNHI